jgi:hypothetical protein
MRRRIMIVAALLATLLLAAQSYATTARINSMGGGVKNFTIMDDRNISFLPAELVKYGNWAGIELGAGDFYDPNENLVSDFTSFAVHYNIGERTVIGLMGSNEQRPALDTDMFPDVLQGPTISNFGEDGPNHRGTLFIAHGDAAMRWGARVGIYGQSNKQTNQDADPETTESYGPFIWDLGAGVGMEMGGGTIDIGVGLQSGKAKEEFDPEPPYGSENTQTDINLLARGSFPVGSGDDMLIPFLGVDLTSAKGQSNEPDAPEIKGSATRIMIGSDLNIPVGGGVLIQPGLGVAFASGKETGTVEGVEVEQKSSTQTLPFFNLAAEIAVWDWMDFRFGGAQYVNFTTDEETQDGDNVGIKDEYSSVSHSLATGLAFNLPGEVVIDLQVHTDWWRSGPYILTGNDQTFGVNAAITKDW